MHSRHPVEEAGREADNGFVHVRGAREHNLKNVSLNIPRDSLVVFTGLSGSGKSSLAFGTLYAEAQRRYLESVSPYARRLFQQMPVPDVDGVDGLPPAIALQQQRGGSSGRSSVGSITTLSNLLRMLYSRAGDYPPGLARLEAESFSPNTPMGACKRCHGLGRIHDVTEESMVPDPSRTLRERAVASWPSAWQGQNLRDILITRGVDVDIPWRDLPKKTREWILFTDETPTHPVYPGLTHAQVVQAMTQGVEPAYQGTFTGARRYILQTFAKSQSAMMRRRVEAFMITTLCPSCHGQRLNADALRVTFGGHTITAMTALPLETIAATLRATIGAKPAADATAIAAERIVQDMAARIGVLEELGLGYLQMDRGVQTLSPGEYQRLRLGTQIHSNLFGVVYVLDEPSAGLHPADTQALLTALERLRRAGNSLFLVEHNLDIIRHAQWVVDVGPQAGTRGGEILYSGPLAGLEDIAASHTRHYVFAPSARVAYTPRTPQAWLRLDGMTWNNLDNLSAAFPLGTLVAVTGVSGSGKSSLVSQVLTSIVARALGQTPVVEEGEDLIVASNPMGEPQGHIVEGLEHIRRLVVIDQKPIGRTLRSNLATYTGLFDMIRKLYARTELAQKRGYDAGYFSFNLPKGRCPTCEGAGATMVELLFLPSVYAPCPTCHGARYKPQVLEVSYRDRSIADLLAMTVDEACLFLAEDAGPAQILATLQRGGLGHLTLGQPATELSGGEAQRIKLATELQKQRRGHTLYVLDEPTTGLHPFDADRLMEHLHELVQAGNTVLVAEHDMRLVARSDWVIDLGPGAGSRGGRIVAQGVPYDVAHTQGSTTGPFLARYTG